MVANIYIRSLRRPCDTHRIRRCSYIIFRGRKTHLRENEAVLVGEGEAATLSHFVVQPRGVLQSSEVQRVLDILTRHEEVVLEISVRHRVASDRVQVLLGALLVQLFERADCSR